MTDPDCEPGKHGRAALDELRRLATEMPDRGRAVCKACDVIQEALEHLAVENARLHDGLDRESALRVQAQEFRRFIYEESPFSMTIATLADGRFVDVNDAFVTRTGYAREDVIGRTSTEIGLWADGEGRERLVNALRNDGQIDGIEIRVRTAAGEVIHGRFFARLITLNGERCILSITQNVEERRRAEEEAIRLREFYENLLALLPAHIILVDSAGRLEYVSPSAVPDAELRSSLVGLTMQESCERRGIGHDIGEQRSEWINLVLARNEVMQFEERTVLDSGEVEHWIRTHKPVLNRDGAIAHVLIYSLDVTELRKLEDQFRQAQKMEAVGRLAGGVAHDFNNLLTAIMGTADLLVGQSRDPEAVESGAGEVLRIAERGAALTHQLLAFSRRQVANRTAVSLNRIIENMQELLRRLIGEDIVLQVDLCQALPEVCADVSQMEQVLLNLVVNARDAMPQGGVITLRTYIHKPLRNRAGRRGVEGDQVCLAVSDTGIGMEPEVLARVFEPFFTTKEEGKGTGLGLSTVYAIVQGCDAGIVAESIPGQGSEFTLTFPAAVAGNLASDEPSMQRRRGRAAGTILVVEDEDAVRNVVKRILEKEGYFVRSAANAREALDILNANSDDIDLVITDMVMPGLSGRDLAECIVGTWPGTRIMFMSGHIDNKDSRFIAEQLGERFIQKPFTADVLAARVARVLRAG